MGKPIACHGLWLAALMLPLALLLAGCGGRAIEFVDVTLPPPVRVAAPEADYGDVAWLPSGQMALQFSQERPSKTPVGPSLGIYRVGLLNLETDAWTVLVSDFPPECNRASSYINNLTPMPSGGAYALLCGGQGVSGLLYTWNDTSAVADELVSFAFEPGDYVLGAGWPILIEDRVGSGLNNALRWVQEDGSSERRLPDFDRAGRPALSHDGRTVAFVGNAKGKRPEDFRGFNQIAAWALFPWDLFFMDPDGSNVRLVYEGLGNPYDLQWASDGRTLYFAGSRPGVDEGGIWRLNLETLASERLWPYNTDFALSPDQTQIALIVREPIGDDMERTFPVIVDLPPSE